MREREDTGHPLVELTKARLRALLREPEAVFWVFVFPILMALALGIAFRTRGPERIPIGVEDRQGAEAVLESLGDVGGMSPRLVPAPQVKLALRDGEVHLVVVPGSPPTYRYDPTRAESRLARLMVDEALQQAAGRVDLWTPEDEQVVAPGSRYIDWLVPGLLGMNIMGTGLWGIGFAIVQARSGKLLKRLIATPMRRGHYLLAQMLARVLFLALEVAAVVGFAWLAFSVSVRGSIAALAIVSLVGALAFGGLGLLLASRARTVEAISGLMNVVMVPMWIVSGVFFSSSNFPDAMQPFIRSLPLTALNEALRAVMMDGDPMNTALGSQMAVLTAWGGVSFAVALRIFRWR